MMNNEVKKKKNMVCERVGKGVICYLFFFFFFSKEGVIGSIFQSSIIALIKMLL